ncbi:hypothetical protein NEOLEDRAFT_1127063, partial [Neolentinus lepideus HHB14362 ss-1]
MGLRLGIVAIFLIWVRLGSRHFPKPIKDRQSALSPTIILTINHHLHNPLQFQCRRRRRHSRSMRRTTLL